MPRLLNSQGGRLNISACSLPQTLLDSSSEPRNFIALQHKGHESSVFGCAFEEDRAARALLRLGDDEPRRERVNPVISLKKPPGDQLLVNVETPHRQLLAWFSLDAADHDDAYQRSQHGRQITEPTQYEEGRKVAEREAERQAREEGDEEERPQRVVAGASSSPLFIHIWSPSLNPRAAESG